MDVPRNAALEAAIRADRENREVYAIYADWLQTHHSVLGELIVLQTSPHAGTPACQARIAEILTSFALPDATRAWATWRFGLWSTLHVGRTVGTMDLTEDIPAFARQLFASPTCGVLEELRIGILRFVHNREDVPAMLHEAARHAWARDLVSLTIGEIAVGISNRTLELGAIAEPIMRAFPNLVGLTLAWGASGRVLRLDGLALPRLRELALDASVLGQATVVDLLRTQLPALETLDLGMIEQPSVAQLLARATPFPRLTRLVVRGSGVTDEALATIRAGLGGVEVRRHTTPRR